MRFIDFLPELSLAYLLWTVFGIILAVTFWLSGNGLSKWLPKPFQDIRYEHIITWFTFIVIILFIKKTFLNISLSEAVGLDHFFTLIIGLALALIFIRLMHKYINYEKLLMEVNVRITPLLWVFVLLLIIAVPLSVIRESSAQVESSHDDSASVNSTNYINRPNIILVIMDALTAEDMQLYGYNRPTTPFITEWAWDATVFNRTYSASNWTTPATMSLLTGQMPWTHKVWYRAESNPVNNYQNNLPMILKDYGYAVYGFVQNHNAHPDTLGIKDAFTTKDRAHTFWITRNLWYEKYAGFFTSRHIVAEWIFENNPLLSLFNPRFFRHPILTSSIRPEIVYDRFFETISRRPEKPFFAYIHVYPPHALYLPPKPYLGTFGNSEKFNTDEKQLKSKLIDDNYQPQRQNDVDDLRRRYDEFVLYSDQQFKEFFIRLSKTVDMSNTIVILSSDHGESFSHGFAGHGYYELYESLVHVPLIIKTPWKATTHATDMPVEQTDIAPTILEFAGIPVPGWMEGRSLFPLLEGKTLEPKPIFSMELIKNRTIGDYPITKGTIAVWDGDYKLIYYLENKVALLFNLRSDPNERNDISNENPEVRQRLLKLVEDELARANIRSLKSTSS
ncbi:MAG: sulfatase-like hydrolase/transferase [Candidatus Omnitrophica bacterium]|nr:sulfatase-like hydrolase/transferase [Candidatus Omnitrophota bacterium]